MNKLKITLGATALAMAAVAIVACSKENSTTGNAIRATTKESE